MSALKERLEAAGFTVPTAVIHGHPALVGRRSRFRWWVTRLHVFGVAFEASELTEGRAEELTAAARRHAVENKRGLPRGLQTGTATIPVFITTGAEPSARSWFAKEPEHLFGALRLPVLVEDEQVSYFRGRMTLGYVYAGHLRDVVETVISPRSTAGPPGQSPGR